MGNSSNNNKFYSWEFSYPVLLVWIDALSKHLHNGVVSVFSGSVRLGMVCTGHMQLGTNKWCN